MVVRSSEYRKAFKPVFSSLAPVYKSNLGYRIERRKTEHSHDTNPFDWFPDDDELEESARPRSAPSHIEKHLQYKKMYDQMAAEAEKKLVIQGTKARIHPAEDDTEAVAQDGDAGTQSPETGEKKNSKSKKQPEAAKSPSCQMMSLKHLRPRKPGYGRKVSKARPMSAPTGRPAKKQEDPGKECTKPPFAPYGSRDQELQTGTKKTHNVLASTDVYPAALRAYKKRQADIERKKEQIRSRACINLRRLEHFNEQMARETAQWDTEYRRHFVEYNNNVYRQALSARLIPRQSAL